MGQRRYPPLKPKEIVDILLSRGYEYDHNQGDHEFYTREVKGKKHMAQVDMKIPEYNSYWIKMVILESGMTRKQFYMSTKKTAKKINCKRASKTELAEWADTK